MNTTDAKRFHSSFDRTGKCWPWKLASTAAGYGRFRLRPKTLLAHRVAWELANGPIPAGMCVLHKCDNPKCCNPAHLFLGTKAENNDDRDKKERQAKGDRSGRRLHAKNWPIGEKHPEAKITTESVRAIRAAYAAGGCSQQQLADRFGIDQTSVSKIILRKKWAHV